ncbi:DUF1194 domain-containing protein [Shimia sp. W99]
MKTGLFALLLAALPGVATAECRQALALGLDVSGSVDSKEYRLQLDGLAAALQHPEVVEALLSLPAHPVDLAVYEWSGPYDQRLLLPWRSIGDLATLQSFAGHLNTVTRSSMDPSTALGTAKTFGGALLARRPACWKHTLDISGDGKSNTGPRPRDIRLPTHITINALVIGSDDTASTDRRQADVGELSSYFRAWVIQGPDAFIETAVGFVDFERAMVRKLKRELQGLSLATGPATPAFRTGDATPAQNPRIAVRSQ